MTQPQITVLGVGNILFKDEGVGIRVVERLLEEYTFPDHVYVIDGGVLGVQLMGIISAADHLIVVDAVKNKGVPGDLHRLEDSEIPQRILAKNSLHQVDLLEALTLCAAIDQRPETTVVGIEPLDITTLSDELTPTIAARLEDLVAMVLDELRRFEIVPGRRRQKLTSTGEERTHTAPPAPTG